MLVGKPNKAIEMIDSLNICGCGNPEIAYESIRQMLLRAKDQNVITDLDNPDGYMLFMAYTLDSMGFLEHGSSIYGAWITEKGKELLKCLDIFKKYSYKYEDFYEAEAVWEEVNDEDKKEEMIENLRKTTTLDKLDEGALCSFLDKLIGIKPNKDHAYSCPIPLWAMDPLNQILGFSFSNMVENYKNYMNKNIRRAISNTTLKGIGLIDISFK